MKNMGWTMQTTVLLGLVVLSGCASTILPSPMVPTSVGTGQDQATIQALHKRLHEREQTIAKQNYKIEVMSSQLEALKRIDQDMREPRRPMHSSVNIAP